MKYSKKSADSVDASGAVLALHELLAIGITLPFVAITLAGMSVITRRKPFWFTVILISIVGAILEVHSAARFGLGWPD